MNKLNDKRFRHHRYTWSWQWGRPSHGWSMLVGEVGGLHFTAAQFHDDDDDRWSCGLEIHRRTPPSPGIAPDHARCWLLEGPCWHDGTSLYAQETLWPRIKDAALAGQHEYVFMRLQFEAIEFFGLAEEVAP